MYGSKKIIKFVLILVLIMLFAGCKLFNNPIKDVKNVLKNFNENSNIDINYTMKTKSGINSTKEESRIVLIKNENSKTKYLEVKDENGINQSYYVNDYLCTFNNNEYNVIKLEDEKIIDKGPIVTNFDFDNLDYSIDVVKTNDTITYDLCIGGSGLEKYIEEIVECQLVNTDSKLDLEVIIDKETEEVKKLTYEININQNEHNTNIVMNVTINAIGKNVSFEIPTEVLEQLDYVINSNNPNFYDDKSNEIVQYYNLDKFKKIVYDYKTNRIIILKDYNIEIYNANTMLLIENLSLLKKPVDIDADNGNLVVGYDNNFFEVYNLLDTNNPFLYQTMVTFDKIFIDDNVVIYCYSDQWCEIIFQNLETNNYNRALSLYQPELALNKDDDLLYVVQTGVNEKELIIFNSQNGNRLYQSNKEAFQYGKILFDGKYVHFNEKTYNRLSGMMVSSSYLNRVYSPFDNFTPMSTLYESNKISFVKSAISDCKIGIYDNISNKFVYTFSLIDGNIIKMKDGKFIAVDGRNQYIGIVNVKSIDSNLVDSETPAIGTINLSADGKQRILKTDKYTDSISDNNFIYTLNKNNYVLNVYDINTLEKVYTEKFVVKPECIDAGFGKLVLGFGDAKQFKIYDTSNWDYEICNSICSISSILIYLNLIIFTVADQSSTIYIYDMEAKGQLPIYYGSYTTMAINRKDGIIYFGERLSSDTSLTYYDILNRKVIYKYRYPHNITSVRYDGNFLHFNDSTFNNISGLIISNSDMARQYQNSSDLSSINTIFDNDAISIFTALKDGEFITVIYDVASNKLLYTYNGKITHANIINNTVVFTNNDSSTIGTISLN